jgi:3-deoxy-manno-octulosonate cytidylyltransferase (CMP-KDO synthetase)
MIAHVWDRVAKARTIDAAVVATDDERIATFCQANSIDVEMTSSDHETGTDRLAEVATRREADLYVNVQGDEPLIEPGTIDACANCLIEAMPRGIGVSTGYLMGATKEQMTSTSCVHLVPDLNGCVLSFSRLPVPLSFREPYKHNIHIGLYAFTHNALKQFSNWERGPVEKAESIELIRFLEHGERIGCVAISSGSIGVDHPEDIKRVEATLNDSKK